VWAPSYHGGRSSLKRAVNGATPVATNSKAMWRVPTSVARATQLFVDAGLLATAYVGAFLVRFEGAVPPALLGTLLVSLPLVVAVQLVVLRAQHIHRMAWRYVSLADAKRIATAVMTATLGLLVVRAVLGSTWFVRHAAGTPLVHFGYASSPIGVLLADAVFACAVLVGVRAIWRVRSESEEIKRRSHTEHRVAVPTLLVGAGRAGALVAHELRSRPDVGLEPIGFVDDDTTKLGAQIAGLPVLGRTEDIARLARGTGARQVLISMASAPGKAVRRVMQICEQASLPVKIVPGLFELISGSKALAQIRDVSLEDLLRREPVDLDLESIGGVIRDRVVLVTGAGGSIGSEICRQAARLSPRKLVLVEQAENNLFFVERELRDNFPGLQVHACIADVCDTSRLDRLFSAHRPQVVFHAAAHKHVPMMEANPGEAVKNNVFGTINVADAADRCGVSEFVLISTDKAVNPTSVMGATKRAAETYIQALSTRSATRYVAVRFGNVLGSAGSVVPIFREQIAKGGPITVTHPDMKRYFMTIPEATQLVLQAAALGSNGEILILDMGEPVRLVDLAHDLIALSGLKAGEDIDIVFTGVRPGEKLFEELSTAEEAAEKTRHPRVFVGRIAAHKWTDLVVKIARLRAVVEREGEGDEVKAALGAVVSEYLPSRPASADDRPKLAAGPPAAVLAR
jgi:FlaA1/EpsC-like NDP-sugar epimerase